MGERMRPGFYWVRGVPEAFGADWQVVQVHGGDVVSFCGAMQEARLDDLVGAQFVGPLPVPGVPPCRASGRAHVYGADGNGSSCYGCGHPNPAHDHG